MPKSRNLDPAADSEATRERPAESTLAGSAQTTPERISQYRLLTPIGEGGMGQVWLAAQETPRREVALKVIKPGMDTKQVIARFESERQALALMDHPNIARVYDAGETEQGRPFFVMELVRGVPITDYCDTYRLGNRQRLELFCEACAAVQHAHQKGIIHRDLKPSNVLVTDQAGQPTPKVIDFGIAKAVAGRLTDSTVFTEYHQWIGTPAYMSPEQAEMSGLDVDTRSDIYSLGVLLYQLLTGTTPFDTQRLRSVPRHELHRVLREEEPPTPSTRVTGEDSKALAERRGVEPRELVESLRGDLDWIVLKAMEKDRTRRYQTANALQLDIVRHLNDEPVLASPPSKLYRLRKAVRRHRVAFMALSAVALALVAGVIGTSWGLLRAVHAEQRARAEAVEAERQRAIAEEVNDFLNADLLAAVAPSGRAGRGRNVTMREVLDAAAKALEEDASAEGGRFSDQPLVEASIRSTLGSTYRRLGELEAAVPHLERALELRRAALGEPAEETSWSLNELGLLRWDQGRLDEAERLYRAALEGARVAVGPEHDDVLHYQVNLANLYRWQGRYVEAEPLYEQVYAVRKRTLGEEAPDTLTTMNSLANQYQETGRYQEAEALHRRALEIHRRRDGEKSPEAVSALSNLANDLSMLGRNDESETLMLQALELKRDLYGADHQLTLNSVSNLGELYQIMGRSEEAEARHREALEGRLRTLGESHPRTLYSMVGVARALNQRGRYAEAESLASRAVGISLRELGEDHPETIREQDTLAESLIGLGRAAEAETILRRQVSLLAKRVEEGRDEGEGAALEPGVELHLGMALAELGRWAEAEPLLVEAAEKLPAGEADTQAAFAYIASFYRAWDAREPGQGYGEKAGRWEE